MLLQIAISDEVIEHLVRATSSICLVEVLLCVNFFFFSVYVSVSIVIVTATRDVCFWVEVMALQGEEIVSESG